MSFHFEPTARTIVVPVTVAGPTRTLEIRLVLDTGAVQSLVAEHLLETIGCNVAGTQPTKSIITASGIVSVPEVAVDRVTALNRTLENLPIVCHTLPPEAGIDGLLVLDFFRDGVLNIDFVRGVVELT